MSSSEKCMTFVKRFVEGKDNSLITKDCDGKVFFPKRGQKVIENVPYLVRIFFEKETFGVYNIIRPLKVSDFSIDENGNISRNYGYYGESLKKKLISFSEASEEEKRVQEQKLTSFCTTKCKIEYEYSFPFTDKKLKREITVFSFPYSLLSKEKERKLILSDSQRKELEELKNKKWEEEERRRWEKGACDFFSTPSEIEKIEGKLKEWNISYEKLTISISIVSEEGKLEDFFRKRDSSIERKIFGIYSGNWQEKELAEKVGSYLMDNTSAYVLGMDGSGPVNPNLYRFSIFEKKFNFFYEYLGGMLGAVGWDVKEVKQ